MYLKLMAIVVGGLILSTTLSAAETKNNPSPKIVSKSSQGKVTKVQPNNPERIHQYNAIFDDYSSGGPAYEHYKK